MFAGLAAMLSHDRSNVENIIQTSLLLHFETIFAVLSLSVRIDIDITNYYLDILLDYLGYYLDN